MKYSNLGHADAQKISDFETFRILGLGILNRCNLLYHPLASCSLCQSGSHLCSQQRQVVVGITLDYLITVCTVNILYSAHSLIYVCLLCATLSHAGALALEHLG